MFSSTALNLLPAPSRMVSAVDAAAEGRREGYHLACRRLMVTDLGGAGSWATAVVQVLSWQRVPRRRLQPLTTAIVLGPLRQAVAEGLGADVAARALWWRAGDGGAAAAVWLLDWSLEDPAAARAAATAGVEGGLRTAVQRVLAWVPSWVVGHATTMAATHAPLDAWVVEQQRTKENPEMHAHMVALLTAAETLRLASRACPLPPALHLQSPSLGGWLAAWLASAEWAAATGYMPPRGRVAADKKAAAAALAVVPLVRHATSRAAIPTPGPLSEATVTFAASGVPRWTRSKAKPKAKAKPVKPRMPPGWAPLSDAAVDPAALQEWRAAEPTDATPPVDAPPAAAVEAAAAAGFSRATPWAAGHLLGVLAGAVKHDDLGDTVALGVLHAVRAATVDAGFKLASWTSGGVAPAPQRAAAAGAPAGGTPAPVPAPAPARPSPCRGDARKRKLPQP